MTTPSAATANIQERLAHASKQLRAVRAEVGKIIYGQDHVIDLVLTTLAAGGHILLIGVPGLAKTLMVETMAKALGMESGRVQCTPDLMPADILGSEVLEEDASGRRSFRFIEGPVFTRFLMADEINRASPRTQSALLQAMQENEVTVGGKHYPLPRPFHVLATQNPIEQEGTYPLPEAQLDRFLMQIDILYPDEKAEREIVLNTTSNRAATLQPVCLPDELLSIQSLVRDMPAGEAVVNAILKLVRNARPGPDMPEMVNKYVSWPPGPRASQALMLAGRARALLDGRAAPSVEDVIELAAPVLRHRMALNHRARADGVSLNDVITEVTRGL